MAQSGIRRGQLSRPRLKESCVQQPPNLFTNAVLGSAGPLGEPSHHPFSLSALPSHPSSPLSDFLEHSESHSLSISPLVFGPEKELRDEGVH